MQQLDGDYCFKFHGGNEIKLTIEGKPVRIKLQEGKTQGTYFTETKGSRAPNAACEGADFTFNGVEYQSSVMTVRVDSSISIETLAAHITSSYVHNLMNTDNTLTKVSLELCNSI